MYMACDNAALKQPWLLLGSGFDGVRLHPQITVPNRKSRRRLCVAMAVEDHKKRHKQFEVLEALPHYAFPQNVELPPVLPVRQKKPYLRPVNVVLREIRRRKKLGIVPEIWLAPRNGMLVPELIPVARKLMKEQAVLEAGVAKLMEVIPVKACSCCEDIHIGATGHLIRTCRGSGSTPRRGIHAWITGCIHDVLLPVETFHLVDRLGNRILHKQRYSIPRLPAITELCIQAGVDHPDYPIVRWARKSGRQVGSGYAQLPESRLRKKYFDLPEEGSETEVEAEDQDQEDQEDNEAVALRHLAVAVNTEIFDESQSPQENGSFRNKLKLEIEEVVSKIEALQASEMEPEELARLAERTVKAFDATRRGVQTLMKKYRVRACGYCSEVHVGPRGHKVKLCGAFKHQQRNGYHGWQEAALSDVFPPNFVWHVPEGHSPELKAELRPYYGQAPAVVELCIQAGARVPIKWRPYMRIDTVIPEVEERHFVV